MTNKSHWEKPDYVHQAGPKKTVKMDLPREAQTI